MLERPISKAGWTRVAFGDVVRKVNDKVDPWDSGLERYVAGEHMDTDDLRIRRWGLIGDDYLGPAFHMRFKPGHVLYGSRRTYLRKVALADFDGITANTTFVLETKDPARLMPELLPFLMQTEAFHSYSIKHSKGSVNPYINFSDLEAFEFMLPPIQEQARLVEALSAHRSLEEKLKEAIHSSRMLQGATFTNAVSDEDIPREEIAKLAKFSSGKLIKVSDLPKLRDDLNPFPVVGGNGVAGFTDQPLAGVPRPCIAIGRVGEYCGAVHFIKQPCWVTDNALFVKSHTDRLRSEYLALCLRHLHLNRHSTGGAQPLMTQGIINRFKIPVPTLPKQDEVISSDQAIAESIHDVLRRFASVQSLGKHLLARGFEK